MLIDKIPWIDHEGECRRRLWSLMADRDRHDAEVLRDAQPWLLHYLPSIGWAAAALSSYDPKSNLLQARRYSACISIPPAASW